MGCDYLANEDDELKIEFTDGRGRILDTVEIEGVDQIYTDVLEGRRR